MLTFCGGRRPCIAMEWSLVDTFRQMGSPLSLLARSLPASLCPTSLRPSLHML